ncbi:MAG TPA: glycosyltransferase [Anaerolineae bacterium]|nr:glycosyltransferase [Anaerolineae bacterium]
MTSYPLPDCMTHPDGAARFAFVTFLMLNDSYLPGALLLAYALRRQKTRADLVCLITPEITPAARQALAQLYSRVIEVERLFVPRKRRQERQDLPFVFTRIHALRLGADGDLGCRYDKLVLLDADVLPLRHYDHLFTLDTPAGIVNESRAAVMEYDAEGRYILPASVAVDGTWKWHRLYEGVCPHGRPIPAALTDRVRTDPTNMGINSSLFVLTPSMAEFAAIQENVRRPEVVELVSDQFHWPEMQYLTLRWSGQWTSVDLRFSGFSGYPDMQTLFGSHYAGIKPWAFKKREALAHWGRHADFQYWFQEYTAMLRDYPRLQDAPRLARLLRQIEELQAELHPPLVKTRGRGGEGARGRKGEGERGRRGDKVTRRPGDRRQR